jgi:hypothetical protein
MRISIQKKWDYNIHFDATFPSKFQCHSILCIELPSTKHAGITAWSRSLDLRLSLRLYRGNESRKSAEIWGSLSGFIPSRCRESSPSPSQKLRRSFRYPATAWVLNVENSNIDHKSDCTFLIVCIYCLSRRRSTGDPCQFDYSRPCFYRPSRIQEQSLMRFQSFYNDEFRNIVESGRGNSSIKKTIDSEICLRFHLFEAICHSDWEIIQSGS